MTAGMLFLLSGDSGTRRRLTHKLSRKGLGVKFCTNSGCRKSCFRSGAKCRFIHHREGNRNADAWDDKVCVKCLIMDDARLELLPERLFSRTRGNGFKKPGQLKRVMCIGCYQGDRLILPRLDALEKLATQQQDDFSQELLEEARVILLRIPGEVLLERIPDVTKSRESHSMPKDIKGMSGAELAKFFRERKQQKSADRNIWLTIQDALSRSTMDAGDDDEIRRRKQWNDQYQIKRTRAENEQSVRTYLETHDTHPRHNLFQYVVVFHGSRGARHP